MLAKIRRRLLTVCPFEFAIVIWCCCFHSRDIQYSDYLVECGYSSRYGARLLKRTIDEKVKIPLTLKWKEGNEFIVDLRDDTLWVECVEGLALV